MTGIEDFNYPAFHALATSINAVNIYYEEYTLLHYIVLNPASIANGDTSKPYDFYIRESLKMIATADAIVFLNGWHKSKGARLEYQCAKLMGITMYNEDFNYLDHSIIDSESDSMPLNGKKEPFIHEESVCVTADKLVNDDRQDTYGHPFWNFKDIATIWGVVLDKDNITPEQVGLCMMGTKIAREKHMHKLDNLVDAAGYAKAVQKIKQYRLENEL